MTSKPSLPVPVPGQRYASELEPELGLGTIIACDGRAVTVRFAGSETTRRYALATSPLRRARFSAGDAVESLSGVTLVIARVDEKDGLLVYRGADGTTLPETALSDHVSQGTPLDRLARGLVDPGALFELRLELLEARRRATGSPARGFVGGRVDLLPHQLYIAREVTRRHAPRVLLADEVGLGKTIEACLILHHLLASGRIERALVLVPEPLLHQWLVELKRRFNLRFSLYDEDRCRALEDSRPGENPFLDDQLVLASTALLAKHPERREQAARAGWDLLVVDEAHHLRWDPKTGASPGYAMVEALARSATGLLLLSATPEQLGLPGHFARLRLLDPDRYPDLGRFLEETARYREVAEMAKALGSGGVLAPAQEARLVELFAGDGEDIRDQVRRAASEPQARTALLDALVDRHGTGRVLLRNTRAAVPGFPGRRVTLAALPRRAASAGDPRVDWLVEQLETGFGEGGEPKALLLCHARVAALRLEAELKARTRVRTALFHEGLTLVARDRNAAWFADPKGARLLICSEIGSEGRNFQFAHHLVLFDLPLDPDLVEQRIGRLDRIGQKETIRIHVPWLEGSEEEVHVAWHSAGLDDLGRSGRGGSRLFELFGRRVRALASGFRGSGAQRRELEALMTEVAEARQQLERELEESRDLLLEWSSFRPAEAQALIADIRAVEADPAFEGLALRLFEHAGIYLEEIAPRTYRLNAEELTSEDFPELGRGDTVMTLDRARALEREDVLFLTSDHPLFVRAADLLLGSAAGTTARGPAPSQPARGSAAPAVLEAVFVLECVAPKALHIDRFLPATPVRVAVEAPPASAGAGRVELAGLLERARALAEERAAQLRAEGTARAHALLDAEAARLRALARVNPAVRAEEIAHAERMLEQVSRVLAGARLRLDALRLLDPGERA